MVYKSFSTSSSIKGSHKLIRLVFGLILLGATVSIIVFYFLQFTIRDGRDQNDISVVDFTDDTNTNPVENSSDTSVSEQDSNLLSVDFGSAVDNFLNSTTGTKSIIVYDLDKQETIHEINSLEKYNTASLYKLFVVYEGYRRVSDGRWSGNDQVGTTGHNVLECLDLAIRESNSPCAEGLWNMIGRTELDKIIVSDYQMNNTDLSHLISTPGDILAIMQLFYKHPHIADDSLIARMKDSFLNQPKTQYDWRQGLPSGFKKANVYNKVGWDYNPDGNYWNIYHDAAIVEYPEDNRHFIVVVMTNHIPFSKITKFGTDFEEIYLNQ